MALLDRFTNKSGLYWRGLILLGLSFSIFFGVIWTAVFPNYGNDILRNLTNAVPWIVGTVIFMGIGAHMTLYGWKHGTSH